MDTQRGEHIERGLNRPRNQDPDDAGRRHSFRVKAQGTASIWQKHDLRGHYRLHDLCLEGCALSGPSAGKPGERVALALHLEGAQTIWLAAEVRRSEEGCVGLRFLETPARIEDRLQDLVVDAYARAHDDGQHLALVIDARPTVRGMLVRGLDRIGEHAVGIATPLDAVQLLLERGTRVATVYLGSQSKYSPSFELVEFIARHYPHIRRVLIGNTAELADAWLAESTGEADALLELPADDDQLRKLVHRIGMLPHDEPS